MNKNVFFIIVSYNGGRQLIELIDQLYEFTVIIVDNGSTDNSVNLIKSNSPEVIILKNRQNLGYGPAANKGIKLGLKMGADWIVILNQDLQVQRRALDEFVNKVRECYPGIVGPFVGSLDKKRMTSITNISSDTPYEYISGGFMAVHKEVVKTIGYFFEPYFMYYEDIDYCVRAKKIFPLCQIKIKGLIHHENSSLGTGSFLHQYYLARNHFLFVQRLGSIRVKLYEFCRFPKTVWEHFARNEHGALEGVKDFILQNFGKYQV